MRNCAWIERGGPTDGRVVWARRGVLALQCPKSVITAQSLSFLEQFRVWKSLGGGAPWPIEAKAAEAMIVLEQALQTEMERGEK